MRERRHDALQAICRSGGDMSEAATVTAAILVIGDEILSGRTKDRNIGTIADHLTAIGIALSEVRIVPDIETEIVEAVNALRGRYDYVFTTGGIGPTHDDITADSIAKAFGVAIDVDPRAVAVMKPYYASRGIELTAARLRMARIPAGADLIANTVSAAPGFVMGNVVVMAGVPHIMQVMLTEVTPRLRTGPRMHSQTLAVARAEGEIAELFARHQAAFPDVVMGSYPCLREGKPCADLVLRSTNPQRLLDAMQQLQAQLEAAGHLG
jgi:molybdenum cofactor synthesis domain-containing protein